jgi:hypothetical protein
MTKKSRISFALLNYLFCALGASAQDYKGIVLDSLTKSPIPFVNIGIVEKNNGTVSNIDGRFKISLPDSNNSDTLRFSFIGYKAKNYLIKDFKLKNIRIDFRILLSQDTIQLKDVIVTAGKKNVIVLGNIPKWKFTNAGLTSNQFGYELGSYYKNNSVLTIDSVQLFFAKCSYDSIFFRLNVYKVEKGMMQNALRHPIYFHLSRKKTLENPMISLADQPVFLDGDFLISIEYMKDLGNQNIWFFARTDSELYPAMYRETSHNKWRYFTNKKDPNKKPGICIRAFTH